MPTQSNSLRRVPGAPSSDIFFSKMKMGPFEKLVDKIREFLNLGVGLVGHSLNLSLQDLRPWRRRCVAVVQLSPIILEKSIYCEHRQFSYGIARLRLPLKRHQAQTVHYVLHWLAWSVVNTYRTGCFGASFSLAS